MLRHFLISATLIVLAYLAGFQLGVYAATQPLPPDCREIPVSTEPVSNPAVRAI